MEATTLLALAALVIFTIVALVRNNNTANTRIYFVYKKGYLYPYLPSYDGMLFNPAYWHLWTILDWIEYAETKYMEELKK